MDELRPDDAAARVAAWHNRHLLARRVTPAQVQGLGWVALPFVQRPGAPPLAGDDVPTLADPLSADALAPGPASPYTGAMAPSQGQTPRLRERALARAAGHTTLVSVGETGTVGAAGAAAAALWAAQASPLQRMAAWPAQLLGAIRVLAQRALTAPARLRAGLRTARAERRQARARSRVLRAAYSEDFMPPLSPARTARWALRHGRLHPRLAGLPLREVLADAAWARQGSGLTRLYLATAAVEVGPRRVRLLLAPAGGAGAGAVQVIGPRLLSPQRSAAAVAALLLAVGSVLRDEVPLPPPFAQWPGVTALSHAATPLLARTHWPPVQAWAQRVVDAWAQADELTVQAPDGKSAAAEHDAGAAAVAAGAGAVGVVNAAGAADVTDVANTTGVTDVTDVAGVAPVPGGTVSTDAAGATDAIHAAGPPRASAAAAAAASLADAAVDQAAAANANANAGLAAIDAAAVGTSAAPGARSASATPAALPPDDLPPAATGSQGRWARPLVAPLDDAAKAAARQAVVDARAARGPVVPGGLPASPPTTASASLLAAKSSAKSSAVSSAKSALPPAALPSAPPATPPATLPANLAATSPSPGPMTASASPALAGIGPSYALTTRALRTRAESEQVQAAVRALLARNTSEPLLVELMPAGDDWRVVCWPFARRQDAQLARALLLTRGLRLEAVEF